MKKDLSDFINSREEWERDNLNKYYNLYLELKVDGDEDKASNDVLAFFKGITLSNPQNDLVNDVNQAIFLLETERDNPEYGIKPGNGKSEYGIPGEYGGGKRKKSRKSRKSRKSNNKRSSKNTKRRRNLVYKKLKLYL